MATIESVSKFYKQYNNQFYKRYYHYFLIALMVLIFILIVSVGVVLYQILHKPLPVFKAIQPNKQQMTLIAFDEPNLLPDTILRFASKAATLAYTFDFVHYQEQLALAKPYFTTAGWQDFLSSVNYVIQRITENRVLVYGVVSGTPVISNEGDLPDIGYAWRVQIPFLVTYYSQSSTPVVKRSFYVIVTIVKTPTSVNPAGIGIDQFVMV